MRNSGRMARNMVMVLCMGAACGSASGADQCTGTWVMMGRDIVVLSNDPSRALHMSTGTCGDGRCSYKERDGDVRNETYAYPQGSDTGIWKSQDGTGKYAGVQNSGWTRRERVVTSVSGGTWTIGTWGGPCF